MSISVKTVAYRNAPPEISARGIERLMKLFPDLVFYFGDQKPDLIYFLSGGSEKEAVEIIKPGGTFLLLAGQEANAYAAATEVKAWADHHHIACTLLRLEEKVTGPLLKLHNIVFNAFRSMHGLRAALVGNVSHWLVASHFPLPLAYERFGIVIEHLPWEALPDYTKCGPNPDFLKLFNKINPDKFIKEAGIYSFLLEVLAKGHFDALTLECFEMVNHHDVTACLALSVLNGKGVVAGCEGDLVSLVGMMLCKALTGTIPWMANIASINKRSALFAHCTAPLNLLKEFEIHTHFETGKSAAVQGYLDAKEVTVFRLNQALDKAFIATGEIVSQPRHGFACRTQVEISLSDEDLSKLRERPLGNHHLILPGNQIDLLKLACRYRQIEVM